jgi:predicted transcriptional regulator
MAYSHKRLEAQLLLSQDISQSRVAELLKISRKTVNRWMGEAGFREGIVSGRKVQLESALARNLPDVTPEESVIFEQKVKDLSLSQRLIASAFAALEDVLTNPETRCSDRLRAAEVVLRQAGGCAVANFGLDPEKEAKVISRDIDRMVEHRELLRGRREKLQLKAKEDF